MLKTLSPLLFSFSLYAGAIFPGEVGSGLPSSETLDFISGFWAFSPKGSDTPILMIEYRLLDEEKGEFLVISHNGRYYEDDSEGSICNLRTGPDGLLFYSTKNKDKRPNYQGYIVSKIRISDTGKLELLDDADEELKEAIRTNEIAGEILKVRNNDRFGGYETPKVTKITPRVLEIISSTEAVFNGIRIKKNENNMLEPIVPYNSGKSLRD